MSEEFLWHVLGCAMWAMKYNRGAGLDFIFVSTRLMLEIKSKAKSCWRAAWTACQLSYFCHLHISPDNNV